mmetsp:Transcript_133926/g.387648  ORF Transcript_133926/g.387648 Transcript_133926/m.387648 type:complete len:260 (+) Transcript_133926:75-854(+)
MRSCHAAVTRIVSFFLLWGACMFFLSDAFCPIAIPFKTKTSMTQRNSVENWISGLTNSPPSKALLTKEMEEALTRGTSLQDTKLACVYKGSKDGWSAVDFHASVDGKGSALVVALSRSGKVFGGFNPLGWRSTDDYYQSNAAFLWFSSGGGKTTKCPILTGGNAAVFDYATGGPCFGAADLLIGEPKAAVMGGFAGPDMMDTAVNSGSLRSGRSSVGGSYDFVKGWPVRGDFQLVELEVYCNEAVSDFSTGSGSSWWPF